MKLMAVVLMLLATALWLVKPVAAGQGSPGAPVSLRIAASSWQGNPGDSVTVSGSGAVPTQAVVVTMSPQADSAVGAFVTQTVTPAADGTFSVVLTIPAGVADGNYALRAEQFSPEGFVLQYYWNAFRVGAGDRGPSLPASGAELAARPGGFNIFIGLGVLVLMLSYGLYSVRF